MSGKGGVGKTTLVANLAISLSQLGKKVIAIDCNITTPHLSSYLGTHDYSLSLNDVLRGDATIMSAVYYHDDIFLVPASKELDDVIGVNIMQLKDSLEELQDAADIVLLDSAPSIGKEAMSVLVASDEIIFITTPMLSAVNDVVRCLEVIEKFDVKKLGIVLNMVRNGKYELNKKDVEKITGLHVLGEIPFDENVLHAVSKNKPVVKYREDSVASIECRKLAAKLFGLEFFPLPIKKKTGFSNIFNIFKKGKAVSIESPEEVFETPLTVKTDIDKIFDAVKRENTIEINQLARELNLKRESVVAWGRILEERGLVEYQKSFFSRDKLRLKNG